MSKKDIAKVAYYYYKQDLIQREIAEKMNFSRQKVNRMLKKALEENIVEIKINGYEEFDLHLEHLLENKYNLYNTIVVKNNVGENAIGIAASNYLNSLIDENIENKGKCDIGISWGHALSNLTRNYQVKDRECPNINVIQLIGGINTSDTSITPEEITNRLALLLGGKSYNLFAPALVNNVELIDMLYKEEYYRKVLTKYHDLDISIVGIGELKESSSIVKYGHIDKEEVLKLRSKGGVGDVTFRVFNSAGEIVDKDFDAAVMGIGKKEILNIPLRIGIAYGAEKVEAIKGAIKGNFINILITDDVTAEGILELK